MLRYSPDGDEDSYELIKSDFGSHFKLSMIIDRNDKELVAGRYILLVSPLWNDCSDKNYLYKHVRTTIYAERQIQLKSCKSKIGYLALC